MIKQTESGLTTEEYNMLKTGKDADGNLLNHHTFKIIAHRYNPIFEEYGGAGAAASNDTAEFVCVTAGNYLFRGLSGGVIERLDTTDSSPTWETVFSDPPPDERATPLALAFDPDGETVYVYACTDTGVKSILSNNYGDTWTSWYDLFETPVEPDSPPQYSDSLTVDPDEGSASSVYDGSGDPENYVAARGFDNTSNIWASDGKPSIAAPQWLMYDFGVARSITKYTLWARPQEHYSQNPRTWHIQSSTDGTTWTTVDSRYNITAWRDSELKTFIIAPLTTAEEDIPTAARYWRIYITANNGAPEATAIREFDMFTTEFGNSDPGFLTAISAPRWDRIHLISRPIAANALYQFGTLTRDELGTWTVAYSDIYWTFEIRAFHAAPATADRDMVVITSDVPGTLTIQNENNKPQSYLFTAGGAIGFTYQYDTWSDHIDIDIVDDVRGWRYRNQTRISSIRNRLYVTAYSSDGTEEYPITGYRAYTSNAEGLYWSHGDFFILPDDAGVYGVELLAVGDYVYAIQAKKAYRALSTLYFGYSAPDAQIDISNDVSDYQYSQESIFQSGFMLENQGDVYADHAILNKDNTVLLAHYAGYRRLDTYAPVLVLVAMSQVETLEITYNIPASKVRVVTRDLMARATDYAQSEQAVTWKSQIVGGDNYLDNSGSNYGGLGHTATQTGSFQTRDQSLEIRSTEASIAFSTLQTNIWNGAHQIGFLINADSPGQERQMGVVWRAVDKDNFWACYYSSTLDKLVMVQKINGYSTTGSFGSTLGWASNPAIVRYIRVEFHYGRTRIYISSDSNAYTRDGARSWTLVRTDYMDCRTKVYGEPYLQRLENCIPESGYVGVIGYGGTII